MQYNIKHSLHPERGKMSNKEALEILDHISNYIKESTVAGQVFEAALLAIEKQIPKETELIDKFYDEVRKCPTCGKTTEYYGKEFFCTKCGQKLKWSDCI